MKQTCDLSGVYPYPPDSSLQIIKGYANDLVIIADVLEECVRRLLIWKEAMEKKGLRVNAGKTKVMICGTSLDLLQRLSSGEYPCTVWCTKVSNNSNYCNSCKLCSRLQQLIPNPDYRWHGKFPPY